MSLLHVESLSLERGGRPILEDISFRMGTGDRMIVRGENGSGKTSLLLAILGLLPVTSGSIGLNGNLLGSRNWRRSRSRVAWVPQEGVLHRFPVAAEEVVAIGLAGQRISRRELGRRVVSAMESTGSAHLKGRCFHRLSGGERRRISIARTLAQGAELLLLDEPTTALDSESRQRLITLIDGLESVAVLAVTHDDSLFASGNWQHKTLEGGCLC